MNWQVSGGYFYSLADAGRRGVEPHCACLCVCVSVTAPITHFLSTTFRPLHLDFTFQEAQKAPVPRAPFISCFKLGNGGEGLLVLFNGRVPVVCHLFNYQ